MDSAMEHVRRLMAEVWADTTHFQAVIYRTPMTSGRCVYYTIGLYLVTIFTIQFVMKSFRPLRLKYLTALHNLFLCLWSATMAAGVAYEFWNHPQSLYVMSCGPVGTEYKGRLFFWYYIFYVSKFYELLDTVILVLRKKQLSFLHVFHHIITLTQFWIITTLHVPPFMTFGPILFNTCVHVIMYFYFCSCALGYYWDQSWRKRITQMQLTQFVVDAAFPLAWPFYEFFVAPGTCYGKEVLVPFMTFNQGVLVSFFCLFYSFYRRQYCGPKKEAPAPAAPKGAKGKGKSKRQ